MHEEPASIHIRLYEDDKHNLVWMDLRNPEVELNTLAPIDHYEGKHY